MGDKRETESECKVDFIEGKKSEQFYEGSWSEKKTSKKRGFLNGIAAWSDIKIPNFEKI